jgi:hypothetical protein
VLRQQVAEARFVERGLARSNKGNFGRVIVRADYVSSQFCQTQGCGKADMTQTQYGDWRILETELG